MIKVLVAILLALHCMNAVAQDITLSKEEITFIRDRIKYKESIILDPVLTKHDLGELAKVIQQDSFFKRVTHTDNRLVIDTLVFTNEEKSHIQNWINSLGDFKWTNRLIDALGMANVTRPDTLRFKSRGARSYTIAPPLFFRNNTLCIFYYTYACGPLCGHGELHIYRKENGKWKDVWQIIDWVS